MRPDQWPRWLKTRKPHNSSRMSSQNGVKSELSVSKFVMACMNRVAETRLLFPKRVVDMIEYCIKGDDETEYIH